MAIAFTADDFDVYFRSNCAGESVKFSVGRLLTDKLLLKLSECWFTLVDCPGRSLTCGFGLRADVRHLLAVGEPLFYHVHD